MNEPEWYECDNDLAGIRVVATDMDCTLLADDGTMPPDMPALIDALDGLGITFCLGPSRLHARGYVFRPSRPHGAHFR